jgi:ribonucleoside-diphosphate reductase beta chain
MNRPVSKWNGPHRGGTLRPTPPGEVAGIRLEGRLTTLSSRIGLADFFNETADPALLESADRGLTELLDYRQLYELWERQQWRTQDLDFSQDREDWHGFPKEERFQRMYGLSSFFIGEQKVTDELGPMMRAAPTEDMRIFLSTQIADEARHVRFFDRFYAEVGVIEAGTLAERLSETASHLNPAFNTLFDDMLGTRVRRLAQEPSDFTALLEAITLYHMVIEGMLALTGQHFIIDFNEREGTLPGFVEGFNFVARDEHRHVAFGARFLRDAVTDDPAHKKVIQRTLEEALPVTDKVLSPPWVEDPSNYEFFGVDINETRDFAAQALTRRLKVIGLVPATA